MTTAYVVSYTNGGKYVKTIATDLDAIKIEHVGNKSVKDSGKLGVNGTFFADSNLTGIAMQNGYGVNTSGSNKYQKGEATSPIGSTVGGGCGGKINIRGTLFYFSPSNGIYNIQPRAVIDFNDFPGATRQNIKWAIGGYSLFLGNSYSSEDNYYTAIQADKCENNTENAIRFGPKSGNKRTAIAYRNHSTRGKQIVLAVFENANAWEVREFMKNTMECSMGVMLDGGGSSQMAYKDSWGNLGYWDAGGINRSIRTMVTVNADTWLGV